MDAKMSVLTAVAVRAKVTVVLKNPLRMTVSS
jgi:hypothetical protein